MSKRTKTTNTETINDTVSQKTIEEKYQKKTQ